MTPPVARRVEITMRAGGSLKRAASASYRAWSARSWSASAPRSGFGSGKRSSWTRDVPGSASIRSPSSGGSHDSVAVRGEQTPENEGGAGRGQGRGEELQERDGGSHVIHGDEELRGPDRREPGAARNRRAGAERHPRETEAEKEADEERMARDESRRRAVSPPHGE